MESGGGQGCALIGCRGPLGQPITGRSQHILTVTGPGWAYIVIAERDYYRSFIYMSN